MRFLVLAFCLLGLTAGLSAQPLGPVRLRISSERLLTIWKRENTGQNLVRFSPSLIVGNLSLIDIKMPADGDDRAVFFTIKVSRANGEVMRILPRSSAKPVMDGMLVVSARTEQLVRLAEDVDVEVPQKGRYFATVSLGVFAERSLSKVRWLHSDTLEIEVLDQPSSSGR